MTSNTSNGEMALSALASKYGGRRLPSARLGHLGCIPIAGTADPVNGSQQLAIFQPLELQGGNEFALPGDRPNSSSVLFSGKQHGCLGSQCVGRRLRSRTERIGSLYAL